ncbi:MAG: arsenate reductase ArsC [Desulfatirhabdiaceae bacterium]
MSKLRVLFICEHNSARSQMAEAFLRKYGGDEFDVESAGLEPTPINPLAVEVMKEVGIDINHKTSQSVFALFKQGNLYTHVITVCDAAADKCPVFPGYTKRHHWPFDDPARFSGPWEEQRAQTRQIRDQIEYKIKEWVAEMRLMIRRHNDIG